MAEDVRRSAEIRRMASQKVAAELIKASGWELDAGLDISVFVKLVDLVDEDVVLAGDRAESNLRRAPNRAEASSYTENNVARIAPLPPLNPKQREKMLTFLETFVVSAVANQKTADGKLGQAEWKVLLWMANLPVNVTHYDLVTEHMTVGQAEEIHKAVMKALPDNAA